MTFDKPIREQEKDKYEKYTDEETDIRFYEIGDEKFPSVTSILGEDPEKKKAIQDWRERHDNPEGFTFLWQKTGDLMHHKILSQYTDEGVEIKPPNLSDAGPEVIAKAIQFSDKAMEMWNHLNPVIHERPRIENVVWGEKHGYAGSADFIGTLELPGKLEETLVVMDLKSSPWVHLKDDLDMQLAAYREALKSFNIPTPDKAVGIGLCGDPSRNNSMQCNVKILNKNQLETSFEQFINLKNKLGM